MVLSKALFRIKRANQPLRIPLDVLGGEKT